MKPVLVVDKIQKYYGNRGNITKAVDNISFSVEHGEFVGVMGPSGSGKTTLLNCISTIDTVTSGHIFINDSDITTLKKGDLSKFRREELGFIFQDFNLLDTLNAYENIALALTIQKVKPDTIDKRIKEVAHKLNILDVLQKYPYQMSGGQKQRVAIARALVTRPAVLFADEPTGNLDAENAESVAAILSRASMRYGQTIVMVTHDRQMADYADRILSMENIVACMK